MQLGKNIGKLRQIFRHPEPSGPEEDLGPGVDIIIVPGIWIEHSSGSAKSTCSWIKPLTECTTNDARVFLFTYQLEVDGSSLWEQLLGQSDGLIKGLESCRVALDHPQRPLLLIGQSLGGLIVKKALGQGARSRHAYHDLTSSIIFLGVPHLVDPSAEGWTNLELLMKGKRKDIDKANMDPHEKELVISVCQQFDNLHVNIPILSVYETKQTKMGGKTRFRNKGVEILLSKTMVEIKAPREQLVHVDKTHNELGLLGENDPFYPKLVEFLAMFMQHAHKNIESANRQLSGAISNLFLRPRSSTSSFSDNSSFVQDTPSYTETPSYTPSIGLGVTQQSTPLPWTPAGPPAGRVAFPFSHTASITRSQEFYGRSDVLDEIDYAFGLKQRPGAADGQAPTTLDLEPLSAEEARPKAYVLSGMAGVGKTETASEYLYSRRDSFDAVIWIYADTTRKLAAEFVTLANEVDSDAVSEGLEEDSARKIVHEWLAEPLGYRTERGRYSEVTGKWLMVFDNADDPDVLSTWLPDLGPGCILVTGKYPYVKEAVHRLEQGLDLDVFSPEIGGAMLRKFSGVQRAADEEAASIRVAKILGGLPLAIVQMSAIIRKDHLSFKDFEELYAEDMKKLHYQRESGMKTSYPHTIGTAWAVDGLSAPARALLNVLSVFDPDRIPEELLTDGAKEVTLDDYPIKKPQYFAARAELIHAALLTRNMAANKLKIHRLVQDVVRHKMTETELHAVFAAAAVLISSLWPYVSGTDPTRNQSWRVPIADEYAPHIDTVQHHLSTQVEEGKYDGTATCGFVFSSYAWYLSERGISDKAMQFASLARTILGKSLENGQGDEERITHWLGEAHHTLSLIGCTTGSSDGIKDANIWLGILQDRLEEYDQDFDQIALATAYNQLGICLVAKGEIEEAIGNFKKSLETFERVEDRPQFSGTFAAISLALSLLMTGAPADEAEAALTPTLEEHERVLGVDDTTTTESGHIWRTMGNIRNAQGRYEEALEYHERALRNILANLGDKHKFSGDCAYSLAVDLIRNGDNNRALQQLDAALAAFAEQPNNSAVVARTLWKKGCLLRDRGDEAAGAKLFREAMKLRHKVAPKDRRKVEELVDEDWTKLVFYWSR